MIEPLMTVEEHALLSKITDEVNSIPPEQFRKLVNETLWTSSSNVDGQIVQKTRKLCELETSHLRNIMVTQKHISFGISRIIMHILETRWKQEAIDQWMRS